MYKLTPSDGTAGAFGFGFFGFFLNLTQPNKSPRVWFFSAHVVQVR